MPKADWKRENVWLRMALVAPTKAGKTTGALAVASHLFEEEGGLPITLVDTEYRRGALYANVFDIAHYRVIEGSYSPVAYIREIDEAEQENPGGILVLDSVSHEWNNSGGVLEIADSKGGGNWKEATPAHNRFMNKVAACQMHVIVCVRAKTKYQWSDDDGKRIAPRKLGVGPEQRDNFLYDYDIEGDIDLATHLCTFTQREEPGREAVLNGKVLPLIPDNDPAAPNPVAEALTGWLREGDPMPERPEAAAPADVAALVELLQAEGIPQDKIDLGFDRARRDGRGVLPAEYVRTKTEEAQQRAEQLGRQAEAANA